MSQRRPEASLPRASDPTNQSITDSVAATPSHARRRPRSLWLVLFICALFTLLLTALFGYLALGPPAR